MPITFVRKAPVRAEPVSEEQAAEGLSQYANLIDAVGAEAPQLAKLELQLADIKAAIAPLAARKASMAELLMKEADDIGKEADDTPIFKGEKYEVELGAKKVSREVSDTEALKKAFDQTDPKLFMTVAEVKLTIIDKYLTKEEQAPFVTVTRGKREPKLSKKS